MKKISTGIYGLNPLLDGGFNINSTTVVLGPAGSGKTTFALQFVMRGVELGDDGLFVSLDESKRQIIRTAIEMGWDEIRTYINDGKLVFIDASGKRFSEFIREELPELVSKWRGTKTRIAIDPLTPVMWTTKSRYELRELLMILMKEMTQVGTVLSTLEIYSGQNNGISDDTAIPVYLADCVILLRSARESNTTLRTIEILKCRNSRHSESAHPYRILSGIGLVIETLQSAESSAQNKMVQNLLNEFKTRGYKLPPKVQLRFKRALSKLRDDELQKLVPGSLLDSILNEYLK